MRLLNRLNAVAALIVLVFAASILSAQSGKLPDGQPIMQGMYTRAGVKGLEAEPPFNPIDPGEKNPLSVSNREDGLGPYPRIFGQGGNVLRGAQQRAQRRTGIVFPENKKLPWRPEEDAKRRQFLLAMNILTKISGSSWATHSDTGKAIRSLSIRPTSMAAWRIRGRYRI